LAYDDELDRLSAEIRVLPIRDSANLNRIVNELGNIIAIAIPKSAAERYDVPIRRAHNAFFPAMIIGGAPDQTPRTWPQGQAEMIGVIESIKHAVALGKPAGSALEKAKVLNSVFIVHGHDHAMLHEIENYVRRLNLKPIVLQEEASRSRTIIEKIEQHEDVSFAIILLSADDRGRAASDPIESEKPRPRQNAVLELGFFVGRLGRENVTVVVDADADDAVEFPSDIAGVVTVRYRPGGDWKIRLMREFRASGLQFDPARS
jgi:predicted nucleotide-binding protein